MDNRTNRKSNNVSNSSRVRNTSARNSSNAAKASTRKSSASRNSSNRRKQDRRTVEKQKSFLRTEIIGILIILIGMILFLSNFGILGSLGDIISDFLYDIFGMGSYFFPVALMAAVFVSLKERGNFLCVLKVISVFLLSIIVSSVLHLVLSSGGVLGEIIAEGLSTILGRVGAYLVIIALFVICMVIITERSFIQATKTGAERTGAAVRTGARITASAAKNGYDRLSELQKENKIRRDMRREEDRLRKLEESFERDIESQRSVYNVEYLDDPGNDYEEFGTAVNTANDLSRNDSESGRDITVSGYQSENLFSGETIDINGAELSGYAVSASKGIFQPSQNTDPSIFDKTSGPEVAGIGFDMSGETMESDENFDISNESESFDQTTDDTYIKTSENAEPAESVNTDSGVDNAKPVHRHESKSDTEGTKENIVIEKPKPYVFPPVSLLKRGRKALGNNRQDMRETAVKLEKVLSEFGVGVTVNNVIRGPRVTRFEMIPDVGVKVSKITALEGDIKLALAAREIRIEAPIPGKSAVGIEVPNDESGTVSFRDILESDDFKNSNSKLTWGIGMDIQGRPVIGDISKMPHMLVAGTTGSGKSVGINSLIMSILYTATPEEVRLILIDPKVVELSVYNGIPHLLADVVTKPDRALATLNWAVAEMNNRYKLFRESNTRNISGYNEKVDEVSAAMKDDEEKPKKLPYILIIIDELAELMMHSKKDVENCIVSITQLARASGIHLVVATQRPSVDVITGLIKSNIPSRIAYRLPSAVDSRTILDHGGAETLLGNGDMLYKPGDKNSPERIQGAFLSDQEVESVVAYLKKQNSSLPCSLPNGSTKQEAVQIELFESNPQKQSDDRDEYFADAGRLIIATKKASIGALQRKFKLGFNRAARIMDQLFEAGVVSDSEGTKERQILMTPEEFEEILKK